MAGLISAVELAMKWGSSLVKTCSAFKHADDEIHQQVLRVELCWRKTSTQLEFLQRVWGDLEPQHQLLQEDILNVLATTVKAADSRLRRLYKDGSQPPGGSISSLKTKLEKKQKAEYVLLREHLDQALDDMESWQKRFDPSWFLMLRIGGEHIDKELSNVASEDKMMRAASKIRDSLVESPKREVHLVLPETELDSAKIEDVPLSTAKIMHRTNSDKVFVLDTFLCSSTAALQEKRKVVRDLSRKLTNADPARFALLRCVGFVTSQTLNKYTLVFMFPEGMSDPQSLRTLLLSQGQDHSLTHRFNLATQLATAVCSLHTFGFVHKNIRPENVLMLRDQRSNIGSGFLLGFEHVRPEEGRTYLVGDTDWEKNIYLHPHRQGHRLEESYVMQHDIYSLGVCLLEIGLWTSFVQYQEGFLKPTRSEGYVFGADHRTEMGKAESVKRELLTLARESLPRHMGSKYAKVVQTCLTCLDEGSDDFGDESEFQDEDGVLVAVRYIEKVLLQLNTINV